MHCQKPFIICNSSRLYSTIVLLFKLYFVRMIMISNFQTFKFDTCLKVKLILQRISIIKKWDTKNKNDEWYSIHKNYNLLFFEIYFYISGCCSPHQKHRFVLWHFGHSHLKLHLPAPAKSTSLCTLRHEICRTFLEDFCTKHLAYVERVQIILVLISCILHSRIYTS